MTKYSVTIEWDDAPDKLQSGAYLFEIISIHPFKGVNASGWEFILKPDKEPIKRIKDWMTIKVKDKSFAWKLSKLQRFLEVTGLTKAVKNITHEDLVGLKVWAFVKRKPVKSYGEERIESRISYYMEEEPEEPIKKVASPKKAKEDIVDII